MNKHTLLPLIALTLTVSLLVGCSDGASHAGLIQSLADIRNRPSGHIEPLPERPEYQAVLYIGGDQRSPFHLRELQDNAALNQPANPLQPNTLRPRSELEQLPLDSLRLVGTLQFADEKTPTALIDDGRGRIHKVIKGQYLGQDFGRVAEISEDTVFIEETVQDEQGEWVKRPRQLRLATGTDDQ